MDWMNDGRGRTAPAKTAYVMPEQEFMDRIIETVVRTRLNMDAGYGFPPDLSWAATMYSLGRATALAGDVVRCSALLPRLLPYTEHMAWMGHGIGRCMSSRRRIMWKLPSWCRMTTCITPVIRFITAAAVANMSIWTVARGWRGPRRRVSLLMCCSLRHR